MCFDPRPNKLALHVNQAKLYHGGEEEKPEYDTSYGF